MVAALLDALSSDEPWPEAVVADEGLLKALDVVDEPLEVGP